MFLRSFGSKRQSRATMSLEIVIMFLRPFGSKRAKLERLCSYVQKNRLLCSYVLMSKK